MGVGGQLHDPTALPPGKTPYQLQRRLGGPQGRSGRVQKISPPPGFDPRTDQPVPSRYTDCAIPAPIIIIIIIIIIKCSRHFTLQGSFQLLPIHRRVTEHNEISDYHCGVDEDYRRVRYDDARIGNYRRFGWACCLQTLLTSRVLSEDSHSVGLHCTSRRDVGYNIKANSFMWN